MGNEPTIVSGIYVSHLQTLGVKRIIIIASNRHQNPPADSKGDQPARMRYYVSPYDQRLTHSFKYTFDMLSF